MKQYPPAQLLRSATLPLWATLCALPIHAQPEPPDFCFVISEPGDADKPLSRAYVVQQQYRERVRYYNSDQYWLKSDTTITLRSVDLFQQDNGGWRVFQPVEAVSESRVLVIAGEDTMRIDLPDEMQPLMERAWRRWDRPSPEVIRFSSGRYSILVLTEGSRATKAAAALAERLVTEDDARYKKELAELEPYYRDRPPPAPPPVQYDPPPPMTEQDWAEYWAQQPPLKKVKVERTNTDTVWLRISGRIMLTGGCASNMPIFGLEMRTDTGWVERIPFDMTQMDCGMPWADWEDHLVMMPPLRWWVGANQPEGRRELLPGRYRLFFIGGNHARHWTAPFVLD